MNDDFGAFVATSGPRLLRFAVLITGQRADAEDLLQEVLEQAYPRWHVIRQRQPEAYLRRAMTNRLVSRWRSPWNRRRVAGLPDAMRRTVEVVANGVPHPLGAAPRGAVVEVVAAEPYEEVQVWASTEDGRRYQIPWAPGAVLID